MSRAAKSRENRGNQKSSRGLAKHFLALALYTLLALFFTYPLVFNLGDVNASGDPAVMVWSMAWIQHSVTSAATLFDANIFFPTEQALAYTDLLLPSALATIPLYLVTGNPLVSFNVVLILTYILSGYTVFLLARRLMHGMPFAFPAAMFAGAVFALCPFRTGHYTQLNTMTTYFLPLLLLFLHRYLEDGHRFRDMFFIGLFFTLNALSGLYYGIFAALMMAAFYFLWAILSGRLPKVRDFLYGIPVFAVCGAVLVYFLLPYLQLSGAGDHSRSIETAAGGSVIPAALLTSAPESALLGWTPEAFNTTNEDGRPMYELTLYPGIAVVVLTVYGIFRGRMKLHTALYVLLAGAISALSLGPLLQLGNLTIPLPYFFLYEYVPGFGNLRVPARMWAIVMVCLSILAAFGLRALMEKLDGGRAAVALVAISIVAMLEFLPSLPVERHVGQGAGELGDAYSYLVNNSDEDTVVAEIPFAGPEDPFRETPRMYRSTYGWYDLVNGYASYFPEGYEETAAALQSLPSEEGLSEIGRLGIEYIVLHPQEYEDDGLDGESVARAMDEEPSLDRVAGNDETIVYRVERGG